MTSDDNPEYVIKDFLTEERMFQCQDVQGSSIKYVRNIFQKTNISTPLIRTFMCAYQRVREMLVFRKILRMYLMDGPLRFCVFGESTNFKICDITIDITSYQNLHFPLLLQIPRQYQNQMWSDIRVIQEKHYQFDFSYIAMTGNWFQVLL